MKSIFRCRILCSKKLLVFPCCPFDLPSNLFNVYCSFLHARFVSCRPAGSQSSAAQTSSLHILFQNLLLHDLFWIMQKCTCLPTLLEAPPFAHLLVAPETKQKHNEIYRSRKEKLVRSGEAYVLPPHTSTMDV